MMSLPDFIHMYVIVDWLAHDTYKYKQLKSPNGEWTARLMYDCNMRIRAVVFTVYVYYGFISNEH